MNLFNFLNTFDCMQVPDFNSIFQLRENKHFVCNRSHLQRIQNYAARVILRLPMSSSITIHLRSLHWLPVKVRSTYKIACLCYHCHSSIAPSYVTDMLHKSHCTPATLAPAHTPCLFSIDLHTVRQHLVIVHFLLLLLLFGTLFQMMSGVPHHCHHLSLV